MASMISRQKFGNRGRLAEGARRNQTAFVGEIHAPAYPSFLGIVEPHLAVTLGVLTPALANFDEKKEMHGHAGDACDVLARFHGNALDCLAMSADHNLLLAVALDIDSL